ncbi:MAG: beta-propeller domain-containing protein [Deltaproteobacteria bacterium]|nr:beta-propeller domain-containing protein [Deltaproteobacteria bacterium]
MNLFKVNYYLVAAMLLVWLGTVTGCTVTTGDDEPADSGSTVRPDTSSDSASTADTASETVADTSSDSTSETDSDSLSTRGLSTPSGVALQTVSNPKTEFPVMSDDAGPELDDTRASLRAIQEADIVQVDNNQLYTLSRSSGISIIDVSTQDQLRLLGTQGLQGNPFEMYLRGDRIIVLLRGTWLRDEDGRAIGEGSLINTYNVANPAAITLEASVSVEGEIFDSRIVENVLYVVSYKKVQHYELYNQDQYEEEDEHGMAYDEFANFDEENAEVDTGVDPSTLEPPSTTVISLDVSDAANITEVQRLTYDETHLTWADLEWSKKSIAISDDRMYVAGPTDGAHSTIQVIDISNPTGVMTEGAQISIDGAITSRWQMDEYEGVFRVVSQSPSSGYEAFPVIQTFAIASSTEITPLGALTITLPEPERLRSVRFDADRAYVITFKKLDPLFVIDLGDPAAPAQMGSLEMPGFVFHMEPRGDRLIGLGFDPDNDDGGDLHVSLFDVSDMENPQLLSRVYFGPEWEGVYYFTEGAIDQTLREDQNRIHKLFKIFDDIGLIMVPFAGWGDENAGCGTFSSGVQLVSFTDNELVKRKLIGDTGIVRRAFLHNERMFTFSEDKVQSFNIDDLDNPERTAYLPTTLRVHRTAVAGDNAIRITSMWNERVAYADLVPLSSVTQNEMGGMLNLAALLNDDTQSCEYHNDAPFMNAPMFVFGSHVAIAVVHPASGQDYNVTSLIVLDTTGTQPVVAAQLELDFEPIQTGLGQGIVQMGDALVFQRPGDSINDAQTMQNIALEIVDMTNPAAPLLLPGIAKDYAAGTTGLHVTGNFTSSGYFAYDDDGYVNYFLDRTDFTSFAGAESLAPIPFPGLLLGPLGQDYLGLDFAWDFNDQQTESDCYTNGGEWDADQVVCWYPSRVLSQVAVTEGVATATSSSPLGNDLQIRAMYSGTERYYLPALDLSSEDAEYYENSSYGPQAIVVIGTSDSGVAVNKINIDWGYTPQSPKMVGDDLYYLNGTSLSRVSAPTVETAALTSQYIGCSAYHLTIANDNAIISCGDDGVRVIPLSDFTQP